MRDIFSKEFWAERDMELLIGKFLRYGVILACGITLTAYPFWSSKSFNFVV